MPNIPTSENPLEWSIGEQNAAAKEAGLTLEEWQDQQKGSPEPDLYFHTSGPDSTEASE